MLTVHFVPAVIAAGAPEQTAFMSDEAMESVPGLKPIQYTAKHYALYLGKMVERTKKLNKGEVMRGNLGGYKNICIAPLWYYSVVEASVLCSLKLLEEIIFVINLDNFVKTCFHSDIKKTHYTIRFDSDDRPSSVVLSGSPPGLDAPQTGDVFVGDDHSKTAAAPTAKGC